MSDGTAASRKSKYQDPGALNVDMDYMLSGGNIRAEQTAGDDGAAGIEVAVEGWFRNAVESDTGFGAVGGERSTEIKIVDVLAVVGDGDSSGRVDDDCTVGQMADVGFREIF